MIKVLQVIEDMGLNSGVSSMLLNYYKYMNHDKVNFDFITFKPVPEDVKEYCEKNLYILRQRKNMGSDVVYFTVIMQKVLTWQLKSSEIISLTTMVFFMQM